MTLEREVKHYKQQIALKYAELVYFGLWFTPLREALDGFVETTQQNVTGSVKLALYKGNVSIASRKPASLRCTRRSCRPSRWATATTRKMRLDSFAFLACLRGRAPSC